MKRFECLQAIGTLVKNELFVTTAGGATAEWNGVRPSDGNIQVKTLGLCSSIGSRGWRSLSRSARFSSLTATARSG